MHRRRFLTGVPVALTVAAAPIAMAEATTPPTYRSSVDAGDFGVVADGRDCSAAMMAAIAYCMERELELVLPAGDIILDSGLTIAGNGAIKIRGVDAGTQGSRFWIRANAPAVTVRAQCTLENFGIIGEDAPHKTAQDGIAIINTSNVYLRNIVFEYCYNSLRLEDACFYCYFENLRWFSCTNDHVHGTGTATSGYAVQFFQCQMTPSRGRNGFYFENAGSILMSDCMLSPANLSGRSFHLVSNAPDAGVHQISNTVFEGSFKEAVRIEGQDRPVRYVYFSNCYFNQSGVITEPTPGVKIPAPDTITLIDVERVYFSNCYISGLNAGLTFAGSAKFISLANCEFQMAGPVSVIRSLAGATVHGFDVVACNYEGSQRFLELDSIVVGGISRIHVQGGFLGSHERPVSCKSQDAGKVMIQNTDCRLTRNGGVSTFNNGSAQFLIPHGLLGTPSRFGATPASRDAGQAEILAVTVDATHLKIECKTMAPGTAGSVKWSWYAET